MGHPDYPARILAPPVPAAMGAVLGIVYRAIAAHLLGMPGSSRGWAGPGAVTLIQRFGSALRAALTQAGRGKKSGVSARSPAERHRANPCVPGAYNTGAGQPPAPAALRSARTPPARATSACASENLCSIAATAR
jgi:hypothetical protein